MLVIFIYFKKFKKIFFSFEIVESIPTDIVYPSYKLHNSTFYAWTTLLKNAKKTVDIAAFYWNLRDKNNYKTSWQVFLKIIYFKS